MTAPETLHVDTAAVPVHLAPHYGQLQDQIGDIRHKDNKGYHDGAQVEDWLDFTLGAQNWSFTILEHGRDEESDEVWISGELTAIFWLPDDDGRITPHRVVKQNFGGQQIKRFKGRSDGQGGTVVGKAISIADDRKGAATDCLKRCARLLGVSRYLWRKPDSLDLPYHRDDEEEAARNRPTGRAQGSQERPEARNGPPSSPTPIRASQAQEQPPVPLTPGERAALENKYEDLRKTARNLGFQASWSTNGHEAWNDIQLPKYIALFEQYLSRSRAAR